MIWNLRSLRGTGTGVAAVGLFVWRLRGEKGHISITVEGMDIEAIPWALLCPVKHFPNCRVVPKLEVLRSQRLFQKKTAFPVSTKVELNV